MVSPNDSLFLVSSTATDSRPLSPPYSPALPSPFLIWSRISTPMAVQAGFDIQNLFREAQRRWLKPPEVLFILLNHDKFPIHQLPVDKPPSGSLLLFNRRVHRFFRMDGYKWKKKKDGRSVAEGHERLKVENVESLNCYYAHGEQNHSFQRRSYWMLNPAYDYIVLVHYLDVSKSSMCSDSCSTLSQTSNYSQNPQFAPGSSEGYEPDQSSCSPGSEEEARLNVVKNGMDYPLSVDRSGNCAMLSEQSDNKTMCGSPNHQIQSLCPDFMIELKASPSWNDKLEFSCSTGTDACGTTSQTSSLDMFPSSSAKTEKEFNYFQHSENNLWSQPPEARNFQLELDESTDFMAALLEGIEDPSRSIPRASTSKQKSEVGLFDKETDTDWIKNMNLPVDSKVFSSHQSEVWLDQMTYMVSPEADVLTVADKQSFSICEISPEWAFSSGNSKVIITGNFLCGPSEFTWKVMFGDIEVPLEIIQEGVLRCIAPQHAPGKVALCVTSGNREACSDVREFEYREKPETFCSRCSRQQTDATKSTEELVQLGRFVQILLYGNNSASLQIKDNTTSEVDLLRELEKRNDRWQKLIQSVNPSDATDFLLQDLLKDKLQNWLSSKCQECIETGYPLSKQDQCVIHLISSLGYEWALNPILSSGIGINFRDDRGWAALHWAAYFGREKMVAALLAAGASAGAVTDPSSQDSVGKTPALIAATNGHKGLAGYLSEVALTSHLSSLKLEEREISKISAAAEAERAVESISEKSVEINAGHAEDQLSLQDSLAAVANAVQAAARLRAAFRAYSFEKKLQEAAASRDEYGMTPEEIHSAALRIQKKYRGWKGRKNFLTVRNHVVKIQAHVRGHQVRRKYKKFLSVAGILEKAILRWRRKGVGLRGFHVVSESMDEVNEDIARVFRRQKVYPALEEAVSRVVSMVESAEARHQYHRVLQRYHQAKGELCNAGEATTSSFHSNQDKNADDDDDWCQLMEEDWDSLELPNTSNT